MMRLTFGLFTEVSDSGLMALLLPTICSDTEEENKMFFFVLFSSHTHIYTYTTHAPRHNLNNVIKIYK